ncbi:hypothetical protein PSAC2689_90330 [Paraburkholderia sacchari]|uniref:hypothetical protein n=1 Tax=Paraburkholderia sacchari TaxID=159450 RepID=UPI0039A60C53
MTAPHFVDMIDYLFPTAARHTSLERPQHIVRSLRSVHALPVAADVVVEVTNAHGKTRYEPLLAVRVEIFEISSPGWEHRYIAEPTLIGAGGPIQDEGFLLVVCDDDERGYYTSMTDDDPDALLRRVQANGLYIEMENEPEDEDHSPDINVLMPVRAVGVVFDQGE